MSSPALANQDSTLSDSQQSIAPTQSEIEENGSNANLDINSIINEVLRKFIDASLGTTEISGGLLSDTINANDIIINELVFSSDGQVIDISDIRRNIIKLEASANQFVVDLRDFNDTLSTNHNSLESSFNILSSNHYSLESSFNDLSSNHYSLESSVNELSNNHYSLESRVKINDISQTFYEIMTQQPNKFKKQANILRNTSTIILDWDYDHLIPYHDYDSIYKSQLAYLSASNIKLAQLPFIDKIQIDISGKFENGTQSGWLDLSTINIPLDICYNTTIYKSLTITKSGNIINDVNNLLNTNNYFDIRVYGINNAINYPSIEERALIYSDLSFEQANVPSKPSIRSNNVLNKSEISISMFVDKTEKDISNSSAKIKTLDISYSLNESLRSSYLSFNSSDYYVKNKNKDFSNNLIEQSVEFSGNITSLFPGSNYNYQARVKNNLNDLSYSEYSDISLSKYTVLPAIQTGTYINFSVDNNIKRYITNSDFDNNEVIYINLSDSNNKIEFENYNLQNFEVTNPDASVNGINMKGYGKFLDTMPSNTPLVIIRVSVDYNIKQNIIYDNSFTRTDVIPSTNNSPSYFFNTNFKIEDMYFNEPVNVNKGFRLKGSLRLNHIADSIGIKEKIGQASASPYKLTFEYIRNPVVNGIFMTKVDHDIYIDDFSGIPVINTIDNSNVVTQLAYNMGIPSVQSFNLKFIRNYNAINSQYNYFVGDKKISKINPILNTSANGDKSIILNNRADIASSGSYYYNYNDFDSATNDYYKNLNYSTSLISNNYNLSWNEIVYNLYSNYRTTGNTFDISHITNHFCDYNSFNKTNNKINNSKLDLTLINVYEIDNISELSNDISNLTLTQYTNHNNVVEDSTLLYIDGSFQSNVGNIYPDLNSYNYNGINLNNIYNARNISYDLSGISTGVNNDGYKFIVFQIKKSNLEDDSDYIFNDISYSRITYDSKSYISIKSMLNGLFDVNIIDKLFDLNDNDAIGFVRVTLKLNNITRIGNLKKEYNPYGGYWLNNGSSPVSYNESLNFGYGCKVENINQDKGIVINPSTVNDNLTLFIGLKNN